MIPLLSLPGVRRFDPFFNLSVRRWIMHRWMSPTVLDLALYRLAALPIPFRRWLNFGPCYRVIMEVSLGG